MRNVGKIALLKLIRDKGPISLNEVVDLIERSGTLYSASPYRDLLYNIRAYPKHPVEDLFRYRLIETEGGVEFSPDARLLASRSLPQLQELFRFSLTRLVEAGENPIQISPIFGQPDSVKSPADIFVAMPFQDRLKPVYTDHILKVAKKLHLTCKRGDDFFTANRIMDDVWSAVYHAKLCIVDCTERNPNVFYELGIAHTLGRKTILITQVIEDIPFDVRHMRTIIYEYTPPGMNRFEETLKRTIQQELNFGE